MAGVGGNVLRKLGKRAVIGVVTAGFGLAFVSNPIGASLEERLGLTWLFSARGEVAAPDDVLVVGLDRRSAEVLDLPPKIRDWPRRLYADAIGRMTADGGSVVALDLILEREREASGDAALVEAVAKAGRVVLFEAMELQREPGPAPLGLLETQRIHPPINELAEAAAGLGPFPLPIVPDRVSQVWLFMPGAGGRPTMPAVAVQLRTIGVYERWLSLLKRAGARGLDAIPGKADELGGAVDLRQAMTAFRAAFLADPTLEERVRQAIGQLAIEGPTRRWLRALTDLYSGADSRYLNFYGPAGTIRTLSLSDVIKGEPDPDLWEGRGVFVGQSELYEPHDDAFITVYSRPDGVKIPGVEIAATAFANLLDDRLIEPSPHWLTIIAGFGMIIGMVGSLLPALWAIPACLGVAGLYVAGAVAVFASAATWLPMTAPLLAELPLGLFAGLFLQYRNARRARENLSKAISYYLPGKIAAGFAEAPDTPLKQDEETYAYCLVTDASGFTTIAETLTSKQLKPFLEAYLAILFETVRDHGGSVTDSVGDGITAAFTSPAPDPAIAAKACQAALAINREVERFNDKHDPLRLPTRIGLNAGRVTLGHVGGAGRYTYTVVGDAVNTASRIEQLNKHLGTRILATQKVVEGVPNLAKRPLGRFQMFGKEEVLAIFEMMDKETQLRPVVLAEFSHALAAFEKQKWQKAANLFDALIRKSDDKTARFYLKICQQNMTTENNRSNHSYIITLHSK